MKKYLCLFVLLIWMLAACAPQSQPTEQSLLPNEDVSKPQPTAEMTSAESAALAALSKALNLPPGQITWLSTEAVEWPDGCLGVQKTDMMCTQVIVPGYKILLQVNGVLYEMRTNETGSQVVQVGGVVPSGTVEEIVVMKLAANLGLRESDVSLLTSSEIEFSDACLGIALFDVTCAKMTVPGKIIMVEANGVQYEYHTNSDGSQIQPATLALTWTRAGGIAGFCDGLTVFLSGEVYGNQCKSQPNETMGTFATLLSSTEREQFNTWFKELGPVDLDMSDPEGVSDRMEVKLAFYGSGNGTLGKTDQQELLLWVQNLYQKLYS
jgi:hypothetical protein